jgi:hypothetical protein
MLPGLHEATSRQQCPHTTTTTPDNTMHPYMMELWMLCSRLPYTVICLFSHQNLDTDAESKLVHLISYVLQNVSQHPGNRTLMYKAELLGTTALDKLIEHVGVTPCCVAHGWLQGRLGQSSSSIIVFVIILIH